jgi:hypothetical protein
MVVCGFSLPCSHTCILLIDMDIYVELLCYLAVNHIWWVTSGLSPRCWQNEPQNTISQWLLHLNLSLSLFVEIYLHRLWPPNTELCKKTLSDNVKVEFILNPAAERVCRLVYSCLQNFLLGGINSQLPTVVYAVTPTSIVSLHYIRKQ